jgi:hypothetical protein
MGAGHRHLSRGKRLDKVIFTILHEVPHIVLGHLKDHEFVIDDARDSPTLGLEEPADEKAGVSWAWSATQPWVTDEAAARSASVTPTRARRSQVPVLGDLSPLRSRVRAVDGDYPRMLLGPVATDDPCGHLYRVAGTDNNRAALAFNVVFPSQHEVCFGLLTQVGQASPVQFPLRESDVVPPVGARRDEPPRPASAATAGTATTGRRGAKRVDRSAASRARP